MTTKPTKCSLCREPLPREWYQVMPMEEIWERLDVPLSVCRWCLVDVEEFLATPSCGVTGRVHDAGWEESRERQPYLKCKDCGAQLEPTPGQGEP